MVTPAVGMPTLTVNPAFAVPFAEAHLPQSERLNRELEALFLARETQEYQNPTPSHVPQPETFESRFNLFMWPEACVQELRRFMLDSVVRTVLATTSLRPEDISRLKFNNHTWFHVSRNAGSFVAHNHPMASWSAVYCVRAGNTPAAHPRSGVLSFFDTRPGANAFTDPANLSLRPEYALGFREIRLTPGLVVVFPSYVFHEVAPYYGDGARITVATNCWFA